MAVDANSALAALEKAQTSFENAQTHAAAASQPWSEVLVRFLTLSVIAFSIVALIASTVLLWRSNAPSNQVLKTVGVITILCFSALLLVVGYSNEQLTPIVGLFGAIAGYLLGKDSKAGKDDQ